MSDKAEFEGPTVSVESGCEDGSAWASEKRGALGVVIPVVAWESKGSESLDGFLKRHLKSFLNPIVSEMVCLI